MCFLPRAAWMCICHITQQGLLFKTCSTGPRYHFTNAVKIYFLSLNLKHVFKIICQMFLLGNFSGMGQPAENNCHSMWVKIPWKQALWVAKKWMIFMKAKLCLILHLYLVLVINRFYFGKENKFFNTCNSFNGKLCYLDMFGLYVLHSKQNFYFLVFFISLL